MYAAAPLCALFFAFSADDEEDDEEEDDEEDGTLPSAANACRSAD
jgi:hypothetical protein